MKIIGIDAGGTKTLFALYDLNGNKEKEVILPTCHYMQVGFDGMKDVLKKGIESVIHENPTEEYFVSFGLAGYGKIAEIREKIEIAVNEICHYPHCINSDATVGMYGALNDQDGILIIAGTGSIVFAKHNEQVKRYGGWGVHIGDEGSAYYIAKRMLNAFSKQADGRNTQGPLYSILMDALDLKNSYELIPYMNKIGGEREKIASLAIYCTKAAELGDVDALSIFDEAAMELSLMINIAASEYETNVNVTYIGGVFKSGNFIMEPLKKYLNSNVHLIAPLFPAEYGAYLLAKKYMNHVFENT